MKSRLMALLAVLLSGCTNGCRPSSMLSDVTRIVYTFEAGAVLTELRWHERYVITADRVIFERRGMLNETQVSAGTWELEVSSDDIASLFVQVQTVDPSSIVRVEPADPPDGGSTRSYTVHYAGDKILELRCDPGTEYTGGTQITTPIDAFLQALTLPAEARTRYKDMP